jgi:hypothetical protein
MHICTSAIDYGSVDLESFNSRPGIKHGPSSRLMVILTTELIRQLELVESYSKKANFEGPQLDVRNVTEVCMCGLQLHSATSV